MDDSIGGRGLLLSAEQLNLQIDKEIRDYEEEQIRLAGELESFNPTAGESLI